MFFFRLFFCCLRPKNTSKDTWSTSNETTKRTQNTSGKGRSDLQKESESQESTKITTTPKRTPVCPVMIFPSHELLERNKEKTKAHISSKKEWEDVKFLGVGAFGYVRLLKNVKTEEFLALKEVKCKSTSSSPEELIESIIHSQLEHKNVIRLFFWRKFGPTLFMYFEYANGGSLGDLKGALAEEDALQYFEQLREGVDFLHSKGVVHRDIKPDNLLLTEDGVLKITDLGLSSIFVWRGVEVPLRGFVGTQHYMAPEIFTGRSYRGPPVDMWACGVVLFNMLTAGLPWSTAISNDNNYVLWVHRRKKIFRRKLWNEIEGLSSLSLIKQLLAVDPSERDSNWLQLRRHENTHQ
ncbi:serine/threonine-protein kinase Chk1-like [Oratosquilla oratoria]|uniref:serine/threonine-protein kinase Chk1-like n=1 Tax=Oratosquilla oratoria TaxID=337810 RepID=UPI003F764362